MATAYTNGDSLALFNTIADDTSINCGGKRGNRELGTMQPLVSTPIPQLVLLAASGANGEGVGTLSVNTDSDLQWLAPGDTVGTAVSIAANETKLIESNDPDKWIRVYWDSDYSTDDLGGEDDITLLTRWPDEDRDTAADEYQAVMFHNQNQLEQPITSIKIWIGTLGTQRVTGSAQLGASGAGTITTATANGFADWPDNGWAHIKTSGGTTREIVYYTSRTATSLTVPSGGRALLGTTAAAGVSTDTIDAVPGIRLAKEAADASNRIQEIADIETAPTSVTFTQPISSATGLTHATLLARENFGVWIHRETPAVAIPQVGMNATINYEFTVGGATYNNAMPMRFNLRDTATEQYELYIGTGGNEPDLTAAPDEEGALPLSSVLTPPMSGIDTYRFVVRKRNAYNLLSLNTFSKAFQLDSNGDEVNTEVSEALGVTLSHIGSGKIRVKAYYSPSLDANPADTWVAYIRTNGTDPDPGVDTPVNIGAMADPDLMTGNVYLTYDTSAYDWNTDFRIILRPKRSSDNEEATDSTVYQIDVDTGAPPLRLIEASANEGYGLAANSIISLTEHSASPAVHTVSLIGQSIFSVEGATVWTASTLGNPCINLDNAISLVNTTISGTGSGSIEVVDANTIYFCVSGTRRAKLDLSGGTFEAASFVQNGVIDDNPNTGPLDTDNGKLYISVWNAIRNVWQPYMQIDSSGTVTFGFPIVQRDS